MFAWFVELLDRVVANFGDFRVTAAVALGVLVTYWTYARLRGEGDDPQLSVEQESRAGYTGMTMSGFHLVLAVVAVIGLLAWPYVVASRLLQLVLLVALLVHYLIEKREVSEI
jgi:hypothetical protein